MTSPARTVMHVVSSGGFYGAERVILELSLGQVAMGWKPLILALDSRGSPSLADQANAAAIPTSVVRNGASMLAQRQAISRFIESNNVDVVHSHGYKGDMLVASLSPAPHVRRIATCHGWITTSPKLAVYESADKLSLHSFDRVAAVSKPIYESLLRWRIPAQRLKLVENGANLDAPKLDAACVRKGLGIAKGQRLVLMVSRLDRGKGIADAVSAVKQLVVRGQDVVLAIAGDGEERENLTRLAASLDISERMRFLGYRSDISDLMGAADVFVIASHSEGLPITLIEAMALERPIVATRVGEIANVLEHGRSGHLFSPGDVNALVRAIEHVLTRPIDAQRLAVSASDRYRLLYSRAAMADRYRRLYEAMD